MYNFEYEERGHAVLLGYMKKEIEAQKRIDSQLAAAQERRLAGAVRGD